MSIPGRVAPVARQSIKTVAAGIDLVRRPAEGLTVLIYHRVGAGNGGQMDLPTDRFEDQVRWLSENSRLIDLDTALAELASGQVPPGVVLTFDDGTTDWVDHVLPVLERHRAPATFYVATSFLEDQVPFPGDGRPLSWSGLAELASSDLVTIGSHTHTHALLDRLRRQQISDELDRSVELLAEHTGDTPRHFAYPKAVLGSSEAQQEVRSRFDSAVIAGTRTNGPGADPYRLARSPVQPSDAMVWFRRKAAGGMSAEDTLRQMLNRARYRGASS